MEYILFWPRLLSVKNYCDITGNIYYREYDLY